jgi:hypothetical protein
MYYNGDETMVQDQFIIEWIPIGIDIISFKSDYEKFHER